MARRRNSSWVETVTSYVAGPIAQIFLRLLFMLVTPLLFSALVLAIAKMGDVGSLKRIGFGTLPLRVLVSSVVVVNALTVTNSFQLRARVDALLATGVLNDTRD